MTSQTACCDHAKVSSDWSIPQPTVFLVPLPHDFPQREHLNSSLSPDISATSSKVQKICNDHSPFSLENRPKPSGTPKDFKVVHTNEPAGSFVPPHLWLRRARFRHIRTQTADQSLSRDAGASVVGRCVRGATSPTKTSSSPCACLPSWRSPGD
jgi:hypothetical protein